jgi:purine-cytosine permease-like protein
MHHLKKYLGLVWMLLGPIGILYLMSTAHSEIAKKPVIDTKIQWTVFIVVFIPISLGLMLFGWYAWKGEYERLPENSEDLEDLEE